MAGDMNDVTPRSDGLRVLGDFWKKAVSWDLKLDEAGWFLSPGESSPVGSIRCAARGGVRWNSHHSKNCVSLSSCWKPESQEGNKSFEPELSRSSVFRVFFGFLCIWTFHISVCFTYLNILYNHIWLYYRTTLLPLLLVQLWPWGVVVVQSNLSVKEICLKIR